MARHGVIGSGRGCVAMGCVDLEREVGDRRNYGRWVMGSVV